MYKLTKEQLLEDVRTAYCDARRHKRQKAYQLLFEAGLEENLRALAEELWLRTYRPRPSMCFIIEDPKKREVFAADFRDRIVHHLYYNYTHTMYERTFVQDSYSCIRGRGTHYGIRRLQRHIRCESLNYTEQCYVLKMDVRGYFMHIDRSRLLAICLRTIDRMAMHRVKKNEEKRWCDVVDIDFVKYLTHEITLLDPTVACNKVGSPSNWDGLPSDKSLFCSPAGCGLPIGNLTSQLFSNVYMNEMDQYMKRTLHCRRYGRYVDDFYVVSNDKMWLHGLVKKVDEFLTQNLRLTLHRGKLTINDVYQGVDFLGATIKPHRIEASRKTVGRMRKKISKLAVCARQGASSSDDRLAVANKLRSSLNSFAGLLKHGCNFHLRNRLFCAKEFMRYGCFDPPKLRYVVHRDLE